MKIKIISKNTRMNAFTAFITIAVIAVTALSGCASDEVSMVVGEEKTPFGEDTEGEYTDTTVEEYSDIVEGLQIAGMEVNFVSSDPLKYPITDEITEELSALPMVEDFDRFDTFYLTNTELKKFFPEQYRNSSYSYYQQNDFGLRGSDKGEIPDLKRDIIELAEGRAFSENEAADGDFVGVVSREFADLNNLQVGSTFILNYETMINSKTMSFCGTDYYDYYEIDPDEQADAADTSDDVFNSYYGITETEAYDPYTTYAADYEPYAATIAYTPDVPDDNLAAAVTAAYIGDLYPEYRVEIPQPAVFEFTVIGIYTTKNIPADPNQTKWFQADAETQRRNIIYTSNNTIEKIKQRALDAERLRYPDFNDDELKEYVNIHPPMTLFSFKDRGAMKEFVDEVKVRYGEQFWFKDYRLVADYGQINRILQFD